MSGCSPPGNEPAPQAGAFYRRALMALQAAQVPFLVGGGYALAHYTGLFVIPRILTSLYTRTIVLTLSRFSTPQDITRT